MNQNIFSDAEQPQLVVPPSQQQQKNFAFYERIVAEDAEQTVSFDRDAMAISSDERPATLTAKLILPTYVRHKKRIGYVRCGQYSERRCRDGIRPLLSVHDFVMDVELCAKRALKPAPILWLAFIVLFQKEDGERVNDYAQIAPRSFDKMLVLIGAQLRRQKIKAIGSYLNRCESEKKKK